MLKSSNIKIKSALLQEAVSIPGTKLNMDFTLNQSKHPGIELSIDHPGILTIRLNGETADVPMANVKIMHRE